MRLVRIVLLLAVLAALAGVALYQYRVLPRNAFVGGVGDEIHIDDFGATLLGSGRVASVGEGAARIAAKGTFVLVDVRVANHAKQVDFTWKDRYLRLVDGEGREYGVAPEAQAFLRSQKANGCASALPPGGTCTTQLVYDVPALAGELHVKLQFGEGLLDMLDTILFGKQRLKLP